MWTDSLKAAAGPTGFRGIKHCPCTANTFRISREIHRAFKPKPEDISQQLEHKCAQGTNYLGLSII